MKKGYKGSLNEQVIANDAFRRVLYTGEKVQLVAMSLLPLQDIGEEDHEGHDQFFHIAQGQGVVTVGETKYEVQAGDVAIVPSGVLHNVENTSQLEALKLYTTYSPAEHIDGLVHQDKPTEENPAEHFDGKTTE